MKIYTALQIGAYHLNHCEDYLITAEIGNDKLLCAVMDGCTMGTDSYFISTYVGKLLFKIAKARGYQELYGFSLLNFNACLPSRFILSNRRTLPCRRKKEEFLKLIGF